MLLVLLLEFWMPLSKSSIHALVEEVSVDDQWLPATNGSAPVL
jgi:hypothetical protein